MYVERLEAGGYKSLSSLADISKADLQRCGVSDELHIEVLMDAVRSTWQTPRHSWVVAHCLSTNVNYGFSTSVKFMV